MEPLPWPLPRTRSTLVVTSNPPNSPARFGGFDRPAHQKDHSARNQQERAGQGANFEWAERPVMRTTFSLMATFSQYVCAGHGNLRPLSEPLRHRPVAAPGTGRMSRYRSGRQRLCANFSGDPGVACLAGT